MIISFIITPLFACFIFYRGWLFYDTYKPRQSRHHWAVSPAYPKMKLGVVMMILGVAIFIMNAIKIIVIN